MARRAAWPVIAVLACACSSDGDARPDRGELPPPSVTAAERASLHAIRLLVAPDPALGALFAGNARGFDVAPLARHEAAWRRQADGWSGLTATAGASADEAVSVALGGIERLSVRIRLDDAGETRGALVDGAIVHRNARSSTDLALAASDTLVEVALVLHDASAPTEHSWSVEPGHGLTASAEPGAALTFRDVAGRARLRMAPLVAFDRAGRRRHLPAAWDGERLSVRVDPSGLEYPILVDPAIESVVWDERFPATNPGPRTEHSVAYDSVRRRVVLFGGRYEPPPTPPPQLPVVYGDTWEWDGSGWTRRSTTGPAPRHFATVAFDSARGRTVLFGGSDALGGFLGDTWEWSGSAWTRVATTGPSSRNAAATAYDGARGRVVLFGGFGCVDPPACSTNDFLSDTWEWNGTVWSQAAASGPPRRNAAGFAHDRLRSRTVLFGGYGCTNPPACTASSFLGDTWTWNGSSWTQASTTGPAPRNLLGVGYDPARGRTIVFGGAGNAGGGNFNDTWEWDGSSWSQTATMGPAWRSSGVAAFDEDRGRLVLFGGADFATTFEDTWEYHARGGACATAAECDTGACVDGVCCESAVCGTCEACNLLNTPGLCSVVTNAQDLDSCALSCASATETALRCDATGSCVATSSVSCGDYVCASPTVCATSCTSEAQCVPDAHCRGTDGTCVPDLANGAACAGAAQCVSGHCVDGVCCATACDGGCESCAASFKAGGPDGTCGPIRAGDDPDGNCTTDAPESCQQTGSCDGNGKCALYASATPCGATACAGGTVTGYLCNGAGICNSSSAPCAPYASCDGAACATSCNSNSDCVATAYCDGASQRCLSAKGDGQPCAIAAECGSGHCVDGVCCNTECTGQCAACNEPSRAGRCTAVTGAPRAGRPACAGTGGECAGACNGASADSCSYPGGETSCGQATCSEGIERSSACGGNGVCVGNADVQCSKYACGSTACKTSCATDGDCALGFRCEVTTRTCVPSTGRCVDGDTAVEDSTGKTPCAPYLCLAGACRTECSRSEECSSDHVCDPATKSCIASDSSAGPTDEGGCGCHVPGTGGRWPTLASVALLLLVPLRRRSPSRLKRPLPRRAH